MSWRQPVVDDVYSSCSVENQTMRLEQHLWWDLTYFPLFFCLAVDRIKQVTHRALVSHPASFMYKKIDREIGRALPFHLVSTILWFSRYIVGRMNLVGIKKRYYQRGWIWRYRELMGWRGMIWKAQRIHKKKKNAILNLS